MLKGRKMFQWRLINLVIVWVMRSGVELLKVRVSLWVEDGSFALLIIVVYHPQEKHKC